MTSKAGRPTPTTEQLPIVIKADRIVRTSQQHAVWLSAARAAERVGVHPRTIKRWIQGGNLPATRTPSPKGMGHLRVRLGDLEALMARGTLR
jgi:excisionase family DNA binding protein